jgi:hypothetical protein
MGRLAQHDATTSPANSNSTAPVHGSSGFAASIADRGSVNHSLSNSMPSDVALPSPLPGASSSGVTVAAVPAAAAMARGGAFTLDDLERLGIAPPVALPPPPPPPAPAAPGAFRGSGYGVDQGPQQVDTLHKGGASLLGRQSNTITEENDPMPRHGSIFFDNEPLPRPDISPFQQEQQQETTTSEPLSQKPKQRLPIVIEPRDSDVFESFPLAAEEAKKKRRNRLLCIVAVVVAVVVIATIVGIVVGVTAQSNDDSVVVDEQDEFVVVGEQVLTDAPSSVIFNVPLDEVFPGNELPNATQQAILTNNVALPQVRAFQWLVQDENWSKYTVRHRRQRYALATLYFATQGPQWFDHSEASNQMPTNLWLNYSANECDWYSSPADGYEDTVCYNYTSTPGDPWDQFYDYQSLVLSGDILYTTRVVSRLQGSLVPELALLTNLYRLNLASQKIEGTIPSELAQLSSTLKSIYLYSCNFTGTIPEQLFQFSQDFRISNNRNLDASSIPTTVGRNTQLAYLLLRDARVQGTFPSELGMATQLKALLLNHNDISGSIPTEIGQLTALEILDLTSTFITGVIPSEVGQARALKTLSVGINNFGGIRGTLPTSLALLYNLEELDASFADLEGVLMPELFIGVGTSNSSGMKPSWPRLRTLRLNANRLSGPLPSEIGLLGGSLKNLFMDANKFQGLIPSELGLLTALTCLAIARNSFDGELPTEVIAFPNSVRLDVLPDLEVIDEEAEFKRVCVP